MLCVILSMMLDLQAGLRNSKGFLRMMRGSGFRVRLILAKISLNLCLSIILSVALPAKGSLLIDRVR